MRAAPAMAAALFSLSIGASAQDKAAPPAPAPVIDEAFLENPANIELGKQVWEKQCRHCHGSSAYPGKAPKLAPGRMEADFIYDRVTFGFRKMPPWKDVFSDEERMAVAAYIKSKEFSP